MRTGASTSTRTGASECRVVPSPSDPSSNSPQQYASRVEVMPQWYLERLAIVSNGAGAPATAVARGVLGHPSNITQKPVTLMPQQYNPCDSVRAQVLLLLTL